MTIRFLAAALLVSAVCAPAQVSRAAVGANGGAIAGVYTVVAEDNEGFGPSVNLFRAVPGATRNINVPAGGGVVIVTFSAECAVINNTDPEANWLELEIRSGAQKLLPTGGTGSVFAFCTSPNYGSHSIQAIARMPQGVHNIRVFAQTRKGNADPVTGNLENWALTVLVSR